MFIIHGTNGGVVPMEDVGDFDCPGCGRKEPFDLLLRYEYTHIYWLVQFLNLVEYWVCCRNCGWGRKANRRKVEEAHGRAPLPFWTRHNLWVLSVLAIVAAGLFLAFTLAWQEFRPRRR